jgi:hypothetical protein
MIHYTLTDTKVKIFVLKFQTILSFKLLLPILLKFVPGFAPFGMTLPNVNRLFVNFFFFGDLLLKPGNANQKGKATKLPLTSHLNSDMAHHLKPKFHLDAVFSGFIICNAFSEVPSIMK